METVTLKQALDAQQIITEASNTIGTYADEKEDATFMLVFTGVQDGTQITRNTGISGQRDQIVESLVRAMSDDENIADVITKAAGVYKMAGPLLSLANRFEKVLNGEPCQCPKCKARRESEAKETPQHDPGDEHKAPSEGPGVPKE